MPKPKRTKEEQRSYNMSRIRSRDTKIEVAFRKALWHKGIRYRKNCKLLPGSPDIAITKHKIAVFCDGEFWHGRDWENKKGSIKSNSEFWTRKIERNMRRDSITDQRLYIDGWMVLRFWGNELQRNIDSCVQEVIDAIEQSKIDKVMAWSESKHDADENISAKN